MPRFAANLGYLFTEHGFLDRFHAAAQAGLRGVEFAQPYAWPCAEIRARLDAHQLACVLVNLPMGDRAKGDFGVACRPGREAQFREGVALGIAYAHALGVPRLNCIAGTAAPGEDRAALRRTLISNLRFAAREFKAAVLELVVEPINTMDVPGFFLPRAPDVAEVIAEVAEPNVFLQCDLYHTAMMGDDPAAILERHWDVIGHIQFADAPGRHEPGSGTIDFAPLFAWIDARGYTGWVSAEYRPSRRTEDTLSTFLRA
jgi:hydroxypyruvate isomerase